jgi:hypothetical protein
MIQSLTPEHELRDEHSVEIDEAYNYVSTILHTADDENMWYGWALREAFLVGISYQKRVDN